MKHFYGWHSSEMRIYIFRCKADREAWLQEDKATHEHLPSDTFVADMRLHATHYGILEANKAYVSLHSPLQFQGAIE